MGLLTIRETANMLRMHPKTLQNYRRSGVGPSWYEIGNRIRYSEADVLAWLEGMKRNVLTGGKGASNGSTD